MIWPFENDTSRVEKKLAKRSLASEPYQFPFLQIGLFLLVLFGMEVILSVWMVRRQKKQLLVEQMRAQG